jgi:voltage-gated sodium channel
MFSLFQIMTMEGWADMVRKMSETSAIATPFFIVYILIATFTVLNLFIAVIVDAMQRVYDDSEEHEIGEIHVLRDELRALNEKMDKLLAAKTETP